MTTELQTAMARYEEARIEYRKAVLSSLNGTAGGGAIKQAIVNLKSANAGLKRMQPPPRRAVIQLAEAENEPWSLTGFDFFRRLLKAS